MNVLKIFEDVCFNLLKYSVTVLPRDVEMAIRNAYEKEKESLAKNQLKSILDNVALAREESFPICQDTGLIFFILEVGEDFPVKKGLINAVRKCVAVATEKIPLRPNAVEIFGGNTGNNVGLNVPWIEWKCVEGEKLKVTVFPKGGGSTNVSRLGMISPAEGLAGIKRFVVECVTEAGARGCPPYFLGIGIGGGEDIALELGKKALLQPIGKRNNDFKAAALEKELLELVNKLEIGVMGLGSGPTVLDVHVCLAARHPASFPVGVVFSCWALRYSAAEISRNGDVRYLTHEFSP